MPSAILIDNLPSFITPEEHKKAVESTPASFSDIPPILRHEEKDVTVSFDPPLQGLSAQTGNLYIAESALFFIVPSGNGFKIEYPAITLHAISRAESKPSIYCQLDENAGQANAVAEEDDMEMRELTLVPQNAESLETIFEALSLCASLHPDKMDEDEDEMDTAFVDTGNFETFDGDANEELSEVGRAALEHLESIIVYPNAKANGDENAEDVA